MGKKIIILLVSVFIVLVGHSSELTNRVDSMIIIAKKAVKSNPEKTKELSEEAMKLSVDNGYREGVSDSYNAMGIYFFVNGNYQKAAENFIESVKISEKLGSKERLEKLYNNLGAIYTRMLRYEPALEYFKKSINLKKETNSISGLCGNYHNLSKLFVIMGNADSSLFYAIKAAEIAEQLKDTLAISKSLVRLGNVYTMLEDYKKSLIYYQKAAEIIDEKNNYGGFGFLMLSIGSSKRELGYANESLFNLKLALDVADSLKHKELFLKTYSEMFQIYKELADFEKAFEYQALYCSMKDSMYSNKSSAAIEEMKAKYETEKKDAEIVLQKANVDKQKAQKIFAFGGIVLALALALILFKRYSDKKKGNEILKGKNKEIREQRKEILDSIQYAKRIQEAILPSPSVVDKVIPSSFIMYNPKDVVSGDFYWTEQVGDLSLFAAADCTGHGVPGAMVSVVCHNALNRAVREFGLTDPGRILEKTREIVIETFTLDGENVKDGMDIALCAINKKKGHLFYAGANNPLYIVRKETGELEEVKASKQPIGNYAEMKGFATHSLGVDKGDMIYISSDGFPDQFGGPKGKKFMYGKFKKLLKSLSVFSLEEQKQELNTTITEWMNYGGEHHEQIDDICVIGVRV